MGPPEGAREPTQAELVEIAAELEEHGAECDRETLSMLRILVIDDPEEFRFRTSYCPPPDEPGTCHVLVEAGRCPAHGCAHGIYRHYRDGLWPFALAQSWPLLVFWAGSYDEPRDVRWEASHLAEECLGEPHDYH